MKIAAAVSIISLFIAFYFAAVPWPYDVLALIGSVVLTWAVITLFDARV